MRHDITDGYHDFKFCYQCFSFVIFRQTVTSSKWDSSDEDDETDGPVSKQLDDDDDDSGEEDWDDVT